MTFPRKHLPSPGIADFASSAGYAAACYIGLPVLSRKIDVKCSGQKLSEAGDFQVELKAGLVKESTRRPTSQY
jgi:hypothetical protein